VELAPLLINRCAFSQGRGREREGRRRLAVQVDRIGPDGFCVPYVGFRTWGRLPGPIAIVVNGQGQLVINSLTAHSASRVPCYATCCIKESTRHWISTLESTQRGRVHFRHSIRVASVLIGPLQEADSYACKPNGFRTLASKQRR
jgi:hypothetical protein